MARKGHMKKTSLLILSTASAMTEVCQGQYTRDELSAVVEVCSALAVAIEEGTTAALVGRIREGGPDYMVKVLKMMYETAEEMAGVERKVADDNPFSNLFAVDLGGEGGGA